MNFQRNKTNSSVLPPIRSARNFRIPFQKPRGSEWHSETKTRAIRTKKRKTKSNCATPNFKFISPKKAKRRSSVRIQRERIVKPFLTPQNKALRRSSRIMDSFPVSLKKYPVRKEKRIKKVLKSGISLCPSFSTFFFPVRIKMDKLNQKFTPPSFVFKRICGLMSDILSNKVKPVDTEQLRESKIKVDDVLSNFELSELMHQYKYMKFSKNSESERLLQKNKSIRKKRYEKILDLKLKGFVIENKKTDNESKIVLNKLVIANLYESLHHFEKAIEVYEELVLFCRKHNLKRYLRLIYNYIGVNYMYLLIKSTDKSKKEFYFVSAIYYFKKQFDISSDNDEKSVALINKGICCLFIGEFVKAMTFINKAVEIAVSSQIKIIALSNLIVLLESGKFGYSSFVELMLKSLFLNSSVVEKRNIQRTFVNILLGNLNLKKKEKKKAGEFFSNAYELAKGDKVLKKYCKMCCMNSIRIIDEYVCSVRKQN